MGRPLSDVELNIKGLDKLLKALKGKQPKLRVGILGDVGRAGPGPSNATIGAAHEFGTSSLPVRSFLRLPISTMLGKELESSGALDKSSVDAVIKAGSVVPWLTKIGIVAEGIVSDAFDSGGFGTWVPSDMRYKTNHQTLVETHQLRDSITSDVQE